MWYCNMCKANSPSECTCGLRSILQPTDAMDTNATTDNLRAELDKLRAELEQAGIESVFRTSEIASLRDELETANDFLAAHQGYTYASKQKTKCAVCSVEKHTPLRVNSLGGYVCLTCIYTELTEARRVICEAVRTKCDGWWARDTETGLHRVFRANERIPADAVPWWNVGGINGAPVPPTDLLQEAVAQMRSAVDSLEDWEAAEACAILLAFLAKIDAMPAKMSGCPKCGKPEIDAMTPRTVYACESSDYDQRPGTFKQSKTCAAILAANNAIRSWAILVKDYNATDEGGIVEVGIAGTRGTRIGFEWSTPEEWCDAVSSALLAANKENKT